MNKYEWLKLQSKSCHEKHDLVIREAMPEALSIDIKVIHLVIGWNRLETFPKTSQESQDSHVSNTVQYSQSVRIFGNSLPTSVSLEMFTGPWHTTKSATLHDCPSHTTARMANPVFWSNTRSAPTVLRMTASNMLVDWMQTSQV